MPLPTASSSRAAADMSANDVRTASFCRGKSPPPEKLACESWEKMRATCSMRALCDDAASSLL